MTDIDIVAELRRKIGNRDGGDGVIGVTFGEMRSLLDAVDVLRWYADEDNYDPESGAPGLWENASCESGQPPEWDFEPDNGERARAALAALERSGE